MKLNDIRRLTVRQQVRITFGLSNGMECVINEHGISRIPKLNSALELSLEDELARAARFTLEPAEAGSGRGGGSKLRSLTREELEAMATATGTSQVPHEHDEA